MMRFIGLVIFLICDVAAFAQLPVGFGIKGGLGLTDAFSAGGDPPNVFTQSATKDYIVGPTLDLRLPLGLGVEADALYRPESLEIRTAVVLNPTTNPTLSTSPFMKHNVNTVEIPILAEYKLPMLRLKPIVEVGPSFRAGGGNYNLGHAGITVGGGLQFKLPLIRLSTDLRYTRWDSNSITDATPNNNQVELLFGASF